MFQPYSYVIRSSSELVCAFSQEALDELEQWRLGLVTAKPSPQSNGNLGYLNATFNSISSPSSLWAKDRHSPPASIPTQLQASSANTEPTRTSDFPIDHLHLYSKPSRCLQISGKHCCIGGHRASSLLSGAWLASIWILARPHRPSIRPFQNTQANFDGYSAPSTRLVPPPRCLRDIVDCRHPSELHSNRDHRETTTSRYNNANQRTSPFLVLWAAQLLLSSHASAHRTARPSLVSVSRQWVFCDLTLS